MTFIDLLETHRWVYWLDKTHPGQDKQTCRVSVVIEDQPGHYPTGNPSNGQQPWYWDEQTCQSKNAERGINCEKAYRIVCSSMFGLQHA